MIENFNDILIEIFYRLIFLFHYIILLFFFFFLENYKLL